jgi:integrase
MKLVAKTIAGLELPAGKQDHIAWDDDIPGFGLRLRVGGARGYVFQYKIGTRQRRIALGAASAVDVGRARGTAANLYHRVKLGEDPAGDKIEAKIKAAETFEAIARRFLEYQSKNRRPRSFLEVQRHLMKYSAPLHAMALTKIERRDVAAVILAVAENSGTVTSNRVRTSLGGLFTWAMQNGLADASPVIGTARAGRERSRERVLTKDELSLIWRHVGGGDYAAIMKILALTGQRAGEIAGLRWAEIQSNTIVLSPERTKNHRSHIVPLSAPARAILEGQPRREGRDLVFGTGKAGWNGWGVRKQKLDAAIEAATGKALASWTVHDIRRSVVTGMAELGIAPHIIEAVVNHVSGHKNGVAGIYNRARYQDETAAALQRWADYLLNRF